MIIDVREIDLQIPTQEDTLRGWLYRNFAIIKNALSKGAGISGTFTTVDGKTITVVNGVITGIT